MKTWWYYKPLLFVLLILIADKVLLIPFVYERVTLRVNPDFDVLNFENEQYLSDTKAVDVWAFGTSRTRPFAFTPSSTDIAASEFLTEAEKERLRNYRIIPFHLPGNVATAYLYHYNYARSKGYKPDAVLIDVSALIMNRNYPGRNTYIHDIAPDSFIVRHPQSFPISFLAEWARGKLLVGSVFPPGLYPGIDKPLMRHENPLQGLKQRFQRPDSLTELSSKDRAEDAFPDLQSAPLYKVFVEMNVLGFVGNFEIDDVAVDSLMHLLEALDREGIPYILWNPPIHRNMLILQDEKGINLAQKRFFEWLKKRKPDVRIVDFIADDRHLQRCRYFTDESHLAGYCYTELAARLTERFSK